MGEPRMSIFGLFAKRPEHTVTNPKVLVCTLNPQFADECSTDGAIYSRHYKRTDVVALSSVDELVRTINRGDYDVIHLFCSLVSGGLPAGTGDAAMTGSELIELCCKRDV